MSSAVTAAPNLTAQTRAFDVRHVQIARALFAALAAVMITFSPDHSAAVGLSVFSGWAVATGLVLLLSAWLVHPTGRRVVPVLLGVLTVLAGMVAGIPPLRSTTLFFAVVITWALASGIAELVAGLRTRRSDDHARDAILIGAVTIALGLGLLLVNPAYSLEYFIQEAGRSGVLTGITIGVGIFGGYAAIIAVFLGIAGFSPRKASAVPAPADDTASAGEPA
jgi:uncharacterized membrane protein HdeD (DUF308 family)